MPETDAADTAVFLSVIIPAYNESRRILPGLRQVREYLQRQPYTWELIVVNDGSADDTASVVATALADDPRARLLSYTPNQGKGYAVRTGVLDATGQYVVFLDADMSTPITEVEPALDYLSDGYDMVVGSRTHPDARIERKAPLFRRLATQIFVLVRIVLVGLGQYTDTQCGFKAYRREAVRPLYERAVINRFMFDVEILFLAERAGLRTVEMPVHWADAEGSTVRFFSGVYRMITDLLRIRWAHLGFRG